MRPSRLGSDPRPPTRPAGKTSSTIRAEIGEDWDIWTMGCPQGESPDQIRDRCDRVIQKVVDLAESVRTLSFGNLA